MAHHYVSACSSWSLFPIPMLGVYRTQRRADYISIVASRNDDGCLPPMGKVFANVGIHLAQKSVHPGHLGWGKGRERVPREESVKPNVSEAPTCYA